MSGNEGYLISGALVLIGGVVFFLGFVKMRKWRIIKDTPRSKIRSMAMGLVEIHGNVEADEVIQSPFSHTDCVYYKYEIKEYRKKTSGSGKNRRTTYRWESVSTGQRSIPFFAVDDTGKAYVNPDGGEFHTTHKRVFYQKSRGVLGSLAGLGKLINALKNFDGDNPDLLAENDWGSELTESPAGFTSASVGDRRYYEHYIASGDNLFILGTAANESSAPGGVVIKKGQNEKTFIISDKPEKAVLKGIKKVMIVCFVFGGLCVLVGAFLILKMAGSIAGL